MVLQQRVSSFAYNSWTGGWYHCRNLPDEVESVTVTQQWWSNSAWFANERRFQTNAMTADSCFFATMGIDVVSGDPRELNNPEVVFISRELAGSMFADKNPIGQTVVYNKQMPMTVKGILKIFPKTPVSMEVVS